MSVLRVYIKPFDDLGEYTEWQDVTEHIDLDSLGSIAVDLDNTEFDIGVYRNSNFSLTMKNEKGFFSDVGTPKSIFRYKRSDSLVKVTWEHQETPPLCGLVLTDEADLSEEITIMTGLLNDDGLSMELDSQNVTFQVLGRESMLQRVIVPFGTISNGDLLSEVVYNCLNQTEITNILTVDQANITMGIDQAIDSIASLQNKTVQEGLNNLLLAGNSVLYIEGDEIKVKPRTAGASVAFTFYGQSAKSNIENIQVIKKIKNGVARVINYLTWKDTTLVSTDIDSTNLLGARKKEFSFEFFTDDVKQLNILDSIRDEFKNPRQEFDLYTPVWYDILALGLLNRVSIDYPTIYFSDFPLPICGVAICGEAVLPKGKWAFQIDPTDHYKILGRSVDLKTGIVKFRLRQIGA